MGQLFELQNGLLVPYNVVNTPFNATLQTSALDAANTKIDNIQLNTTQPDANQTTSQQIASDSVADSTVESTAATNETKSDNNNNLDALVAKIDALEKQNNELQSKLAERAAVGFKDLDLDLDQALNDFFSFGEE